jgi:hypothetical protein
VKYYITTILLVFSILLANADIISGCVIDTDTKETLPGATVQYMKKISETSYSGSTVIADSLGRFSFYTDGRVELEVSMLGYYNKKKNVMALSDSRKDTLNIGAIELKMSSQMLQMIEVTGHAKRFTMHGDTIVFNPSAFRLQEGARLDELIKQLPGVETDANGKLWWNGKPIRLTMDGESLFGGNDLVSQLPAEAVQNIKAYNKASELKEHTGNDDGSEDMVLDLTIKPGFLDSWYGDATAGYRTRDHYEADVLMNRLSKNDPVMVFGDANNMAKRHRRYQGQYTLSMGNGKGQEQGVSGGYQHNWSREQGKETLKSYYSISGGLAHDDRWKNSGSETENYFPGEAQSYNKTTSFDRSHSLNPLILGMMRWRPDTTNMFFVWAQLEYDNNRSINRRQTEQSVDSGNGYIPTVNQHVNTLNRGHETKLITTGDWTHFFKNGSLKIAGRLNYSDSKSKQWTDRAITDYQSDFSSTINQYAVEPSSKFGLNGSMNYQHWLTKSWMLNMDYRLDYSNIRIDREFTTDGMADAANSFSNRYHSTGHTLTAGSTFNLGHVQLLPSAAMNWSREHQDYTRALLDTTAIRNRFKVEPSLKATWKVNSGMNVEMNYSYKTTRPELLQTIGYRDLSDPLFITEGNPGLKDSHTNLIQLAYKAVIPGRQLSIGFNAKYTTSDHGNVTALSYDPTTNVYTSRPESVPGSRTWEVNFNYDHGLGNYFRLQNDLKITGGRYYGFLTMLPTHDERILNRQTSVHPKDKLTVFFDHNWIKASAFAELNADRLRFSQSQSQNTTLWNNNYGMEFEANYRNFIFTSSLTEAMRRGYASSGMNRNRLLWDASITWKILKNKGSVRLFADDILNQDDWRWSSQTAYQQTNEWQDTLHHYIGISFTYHLDAKKKE